MVQSIFRVTIIVIISAIVVGLFGSVAFGWTLSTSGYLQVLTNFLHVIYYVLPIEKLTPLIILSISMMSFRIIVAIIKTLWDLLPIAG